MSILASLKNKIRQFLFLILISYIFDLLLLLLFSDEWPWNFHFNKIPCALVFIICWRLRFWPLRFLNILNFWPQVSPLFDILIYCRRVNWKTNWLWYVSIWLITFSLKLIKWFSSHFYCSDTLQKGYIVISHLCYLSKISYK